MLWSTPTDTDASTCAPPLADPFEPPKMRFMNKVWCVQAANHPAVASGPLLNVTPAVN